MTEKITDPKALRALSHPTRWKVIELLQLERTATATRCAEYSGESVASCSYHLNMLAKYGFVQLADGGQGREKPWRLARRDQSWEAAELDTEGAMAAETLSEIVLDHSHAQMKDFVRRASLLPVPWQLATGMSGRTLHLTADELVEVRSRIDALLAPFENRIEDPTARVDGGRAVRVQITTWLPRTIERPEDRRA